MSKIYIHEPTGFILEINDDIPFITLDILNELIEENTNKKHHANKTQ